MSRSSAHTFLCSKMSFEFKLLGARILKHFILQTGEREYIGKIDLPVIIWKLTPIDVRSDLEIDAHLPSRLKSLSCSHTGKLKGISPDD